MSATVKSRSKGHSAIRRSCLGTHVAGDWPRGRSERLTAIFPSLGIEISAAFATYTLHCQINRVNTIGG